MTDDGFLAGMVRFRLRGNDLTLHADSLAIQRDGRPDRKLRRAILDYSKMPPWLESTPERGMVERLMDLVEWKIESAWLWLAQKTLRYRP